MIAGYLARETFLHRIPAGLKLIMLAVVGAALPFIASLWVPVAMLVAIVAVYAVCGREAMRRLLAMRVLLLFLLLVAVVQGVSLGWHEAFNSVCRLLAMVLLADLVTLSSTMQEMMAATMPILRPFSRLGMDPRRVSLAVAMVLRFIPCLLANWRERDEAYRARTGRRGGWRIVAPFIVETMHLADKVAETMDARGLGIGSGDR